MTEHKSMDIAEDIPQVLARYAVTTTSTDNPVIKVGNGFLQGFGKKKDYKLKGKCVAAFYDGNTIILELDVTKYLNRSTEHKLLEGEVLFMDLELTFSFVENLRVEATGRTDYLKYLYIYYR